MPNTFKDIPKANDIIAVSQVDIEGNFLYLGNTLNTDHQIGPANGAHNDGTAQEGNHVIVHFVNQGADPATVAGVGQLYTKTTGSPTTDQNLFYKSGGGKVSQVTNAAATSSIVLKAACLFVGNPVAITSQFNIASITRTAKGRYTVAFTNPMSNTNYYVLFSAVDLISNPSNVFTIIDGSVTVNGFNFFCEDLTQFFADPIQVQFMVWN